MLTRRTLALLITLASTANAQVPRPARNANAQLPAAISRIREADIKRDLFAMAAPSMRGREGGTLDELRASIWVAEQYRQLGLEPAGDEGTWFQWFNVVRTRVSVTGSALSIGDRALTVPTDVIPLNVLPVDARGAVLWIADARDTTISVRGRIVATPILPPAAGSIRSTSYTDAVRYADAAIGGTMARFARRGAAAVILVADAALDSSFDAMAVMRMRGQYDVDRATPRARGASDRVAPAPVAGSGATPGFLVHTAMGATLQQQTEASVSVRLERFESPSLNVIGILRGTDAMLRNEYVLYSSHQDANGVRLLSPGDSVLAGADDNASVSVAEFAAFRAFRAQRPKRSLLFVHHGAEERGLLGSRYHSAHPVVPLSQIVAVINGDMIGRNHPDTATLLGSQPPHRNSTALVEMALRANAMTGKFVLDTLWDRPTHPEGWYFRSDHLPYARLGVPALMYTTNLHSDYHTAGDIPERIDYAKLTRMAKWMYLTGWFAANAAVRPGLDSGFQLER